MISFIWSPCILTFLCWKLSNDLFSWSLPKNDDACQFSAILWKYIYFVFDIYVCDLPLASQNATYILCPTFGTSLPYLILLIMICGLISFGVSCLIIVYSPIIFLNIRSITNQGCWRQIIEGINIWFCVTLIWQKLKLSIDEASGFVSERINCSM